MKRVTVYLDDHGESVLNKLMMRHCITQSEVFTMGLYSLLDVPDGELFPEPSTVYGKVRRLVYDSFGQSIENYCLERGFDRFTVYNVCNTIQDGKVVRGFGDSNPTRDREDERKYRTKSAAFVAQLFKETGVDIRDYGDDYV